MVRRSAPPLLATLLALNGLHALPTSPIPRSSVCAVRHSVSRQPRVPNLRCSDKQEQSGGRLILVRHGQSEWNAANLFTGWADVDLSERGIIEAREAGQLLQKAGVQIDVAFTSMLRRSIRTACLVLSTVDQCWVPMQKRSELNEQHSGALCGLNKRHLAEIHGVDAVMRWRRGFDAAPPAQSLDSPLYQSIDDGRYKKLDGPPIHVPTGESFKQCCERVRTVYEGSLKPAVAAGKTVLVVSHGNTLRALVKLLDRCSKEDISQVDLPTAAPLIYDLRTIRAADNTVEVVPQHPPEGFWGESHVPRHGHFLTDMNRVRQAQRAMREQVLSNIAVSTYSEQMIQPAYVSAKAADSMVELNGMSYSVRQRPPSYFALESERLEEQAKSEYANMLVKNLRKSVKGHALSVRSVLVLLCHGQSVYNDANLFSGWADVELTNRGREEARLAGRLLRASLGAKPVTRVYTSMLKRAIKTSWLMLDEMETQWVPVHSTWRLNERHYGALQGCDKRQCVHEFGLNQVQKWRRGYNHCPPAWDESAASGVVDRRYINVDVPAAESLHDCRQRLRPFIMDELEPAMRNATETARTLEAAAVASGGNEGDGYDTREIPTFVVCSSENVIRAHIMELEDLTEEEVALLDIPYATPLVYQLDKNMKPLSTPWAQAPLKSGWWLGDPARVEEMQREIRGNLAEGIESSSPALVDDAEQPCIVAYESNGEELLAWNC